MLDAERRGLDAARLALQLLREGGERRHRRRSQGARRLLRHLPQVALLTKGVPHEWTVGG